MTKQRFLIGLISLMGLLVWSCAGPEAPPAARQPGDPLLSELHQAIDKQLQGIDRTALRAKSDLIMEQSISQLQSTISRGQLSYAELTAFYLDRIETFHSAKINLAAVISINPRAMAEAKALDAKPESDRPALSGIPVLLKDNINTRTMPTSGGTLALKDFYPSDDAGLVKQLQAQGAIILGKTNLSELANFISQKLPDGFSARGSQTLNPFDPGRLSPLGSSSGSAAAVAANLSAIALGTETTGSIIAPAQIHSLVGYKPSHGLLSTEGILPLASSMDCPGPIAKSVEDARILVDGLVGADQQIPQPDKADLKGRRIGLWPGEHVQALRQALLRAGAEVIDLPEPEVEDNEIIIQAEFGPDFKAYAARYQAPVASLADLAAFNSQDPKSRIPYGQDLLEMAAQAKIERQTVEPLISRAKRRLDDVMTKQRLDAIAFSNSDHVVLPCTAGAPMITLPFGQDEYDQPRGLSLTGRPGQDSQLFDLAAAFEASGRHRLIPQGYLK